MSEGVGGGLARRAGWRAGVAVALSAALVACGGSEADEDEVASELEALAAATRGIEGSRELLRDAERLAGGADAREIARHARERAAMPASEAQPDLVAAERSHEAAAETLAALASRFEKSAGAVSAKASLKEAQELKGGLAAEAPTMVRRFTTELSSAFAGYRNAAAELVGELENSGEAPPEALADAKAALKDLGQVETAVARVRQALMARVKRLQGAAAELVEQLRGPPALTEPTDCGTNLNGAEVVVNVVDGEVTCEDALWVSENSSGPNSSTAPAGWECSLFARTLDGTQVQGAAGYGCRSDAGAEISIYVPGAVAGGSCGDGLSKGLAAFDIEAQGIDCGVAIEVIRAFVDSGYEEEAELESGFACRSQGASGVEGVAYECSSSAGSIEFDVGG